MANEQTQESQFTDTPGGWAKRLTREFDAARKALKDWHEQAEKALKEYLDERDTKCAGDTRWNIYTSDTQTKEAILYGNPPKAAVTRRFADANDDEARVASEILERLLNSDIEGEDDSFSQAIEYAHSDREKTAFGLCRIRYLMGEEVKEPGRPAITDEQTGQELAPAVPEVARRPNEQVETDWVHWKSILWSPCKVWHHVRWLAFDNDMTREEAQKKFGDVADDLPIAGKKDAKDAKATDPWDRIKVWEVWVKKTKQVFFYVEGYPEVLRPKDVATEKNGGVPDPLGLEGFWPCPRPMFGNVTTDKLVPKPDREFAKDLYDEVNTLSTRITMLERAIRVVGVYDKTNTGLKRMLSETDGNEMIPVDNWAMLAEKGGLRGAVDWFPLEQVVNALVTLRDYRTEQVEALRQITGMSDIMRGQAMDAGSTATEQRIKARFGSVRMERRQKELARFASDLQRLRAEVIAKHFDESTILARCNCEFTHDAQLAPAAVKLIKSDVSKYRIEVKPETISMTDFDALKQERTEVIGAVSQFLSAAAPVGQAMPGSTPFLLEILKWMVSGLRGASEIEGVLDRAIQAAQQQAAQPQQQQQPDPKVIAQQMKGEQDQQKIQMELQADLMRTQAEVQADAQREQNQMQWNVREHAAKTQISAALKPSQAPNGKPGGVR